MGRKQQWTYYAVDRSRTSSRTTHLKPQLSTPDWRPASQFRLAQFRSLCSPSTTKPNTKISHAVEIVNKRRESFGWMTMRNAQCFDLVWVPISLGLRKLSIWRMSSIIIWVSKSDLTLLLFCSNSASDACLYSYHSILAKNEITRQ